MGLGDPRPPRSPRVDGVRAETGQGTVAQMGTPVCAQQLGPGQNCSDQAQNTTNRSNAFQRALMMHTPSYE